MSDEPIAGTHAGVVKYLADQAFARDDGTWRLHAATLLRFAGGAEALGAAVRRVLDAGFDASPWTFRNALDAVVLAGPRLASLRPALVELRRTINEQLASDVDAAIAGIDVRTDAILDSALCNRADLSRLLALGEVGRNRVVALVGGSYETADDLFEWLAGAPLADAITDAARPGDPEDPADVDRRAGAAKPALIWTTAPPAKSTTPFCARKPSGFQIQWQNGT